MTIQIVKLKNGWVARYSRGLDLMNDEKLKAYIFDPDSLYVDWDIAVFTEKDKLLSETTQAIEAKHGQDHVAKGP